MHAFGRGIRAPRSNHIFMYTTWCNTGDISALSILYKYRKAILLITNQMTVIGRKSARINESLADITEGGKSIN